MRAKTRCSAWLLASGIVAVAATATPALADKIKHPTAVFAGLDKITGRIISFEAAINETVQFGSLQITPRVCFSRPPTEAPQTDAFAEVDEAQLDKSIKRIFTGWMFADSPGLHGIEHPVYDVWLTACIGDGPLIREAPQVAEAPPDAAAEGADPNAANSAADPNKAATAQPPKKRKPKPAAPTTTDLPADFASPPPVVAAPPPQSNNFKGNFLQRLFSPGPPTPPADVGQ